MSTTTIDPTILAESAVLEADANFQAARQTSHQVVRPPWWSPLPLVSVALAPLIAVLPTPPQPPPQPQPPVPVAAATTTTTNTTSSRRGDWYHGCTRCPNFAVDRRSRVKDHVLSEHVEQGYNGGNWKELLRENIEKRWR